MPEFTAAHHQPLIRSAQDVNYYADLLDELVTAAGDMLTEHADRIIALRSLQVSLMLQGCGQGDAGAYALAGMRLHEQQQAGAGCRP